MFIVQPSQELFTVISGMILMVLLNNGANAIAKIFAGTKTTNLTIAHLELDTTRSASLTSSSPQQAVTPTTPNPVGSPSVSVVANVCTLTYSITPANNVGTWQQWFLHFRSDLTEGVAADFFTTPGINHDGTKTDVLEFDIATVDA